MKDKRKRIQSIVLVILFVAIMYTPVILSFRGAGVRVSIYDVDKVNNTVTFFARGQWGPSDAVEGVTMRHVDPCSIKETKKDQRQQVKAIKKRYGSYKKFMNATYPGWNTRTKSPNYKKEVRQMCKNQNNQQP